MLIIFAILFATRWWCLLLRIGSESFFRTSVRGKQHATPAPVEARNFVLDREGPGKPVADRRGTRVPVPH
uniref:Putative secreted protein n=1 Tax=Anopheles marajoara TaxID=58244 RepID=A0A2M4CER2_9DIPT